MFHEQNKIDTSNEVTQPWKYVAKFYQEYSLLKY